MDPSLLVDNRVCPYALKYSAMVPLAFNSKSVPVVFATSNQSTYNQNNLLINTTISSGTGFLDGTESFYKFDYRNTSAFTQRFNHSAHSLIETLRVLSNSQALEDIRHYDKLHSLLADMNLSPENRVARLQEGYGCNATPIIDASTNVLDVSGAVGCASTAGVNAELLKLRVGLENHSRASLKCVDELTVAPGDTVTICLPLELSNLVGTQQRKLLPLWLMNNLVIEIGLNKNAVFNVSGANAATTAPTFEISNVQFHGSLIEFESSVNQALVAMASGAAGGPALGIHLHGCTWTNNMSQMAINQNTITYNEQFRSVKSLFVSFIYNGMGHHRRQTERNNNRVTSIQYKFGSQYLPSYPISGDSWEKEKNAEYVVELMKACGEYSNSMHTGLINTESFEYNNPSPTAEAGSAALGIAAVPYKPNECGRSSFGINTESFSKENCESGLNAIINTPIGIKWQGGSAVAQDAYLFVYHDVVYNVMPNGVITKSQ